MPSTNKNYYPLMFTPVYKQALWGGERIEALGRELPKTDAPTSESWEIVDRPEDQSIVTNGELKGATLRQLIQQDPEGIIGAGHCRDEPFPLLLKIIDAQQDLSLQIHPDEESCKHLTGAEPKTEMWYVLDHQDNAQILAGAKDGVTEAMFREKANDPNVRDLMNSHTSNNGDAFFIKATTMHAIGAGNLIYEIQQNSNTTYRVSDWGRVDKNGQPRDLHMDNAMTCLKHKNKTTKTTPYSLNDCSFQAVNADDLFESRQLASCEFFQVDEFNLNGTLSLSTSENSFHTLYAVNSDLTIVHQEKEYLLSFGQSCLLPANMGKYQIKASQKSTFIRSRVS